MFNNRVMLTVDYFNSKSSDLIMPVEISSVYGSNYMYRNMGKVVNQGFEIGAQIGLIQNRCLLYTS